MFVSPPILPLNLLYDSLPCICFAIDTKGLLVIVNKFTLAKLGYTLSDLLSHYLWQITTTEDELVVQDILRFYQSPDASKKILEQKLTLITADGIKISTLVKFNLITDQHAGDFIQVTGGEIISPLQSLSKLNITEVQKNNYHSLNLPAAIFDQAAIGMAICSLEGKFLQVNQKYADIVGYSIAELLTKTSQDITHNQNLAADMVMRQKLIAGEIINGYLEKHYLRKDGELIWGALNISLLRDEAGQHQGFIKTCQDITERKQIEAAFHQQTQKERLVNKIAQRIRQSLHLEEVLNITVTEVRNFLESDRVMIYYFDNSCSGRVVVESVGNPLFSILGVEIHDTCFHKFSVGAYQQGRISQVTDVERDISDSCYRQMLTSLQVKANLVVPILVSKEEKTLTMDMEAPSPSDPNLDDPLSCRINVQSPDLWGLLIAHQCTSPRQWQESEVQLLQQLATQLAIAIQQAQLYTELKNLNQELSGLAWSDGLTQIANRRRFDQYLQVEWSRLAREQAPLTLILCDIDQFKLYNDYYGHLSGDLCLQQVARAIKEVTRRPADLAARYGGEEFAVILPNTSITGGLKVVHDIQQTIAKLEIPHLRSTVHPFITLSIGIATLIPQPGQTPEHLINQADKFLYAAKRAGRNRLCWQD